MAPVFIGAGYPAHDVGLVAYGAKLRKSGTAVRDRQEEHPQRRELHVVVTKRDLPSGKAALDWLARNPIKCENKGNRPQRTAAGMRQPATAAALGAAVSRI